MNESDFRNKVSWVMFLLSVLVIWVHAYNVDLFVQGEPEGIWAYVDRMERFLSESLGQTAVPGFFMLSAYLFFRGFSWEKLAGKWKRRLFSTALPYVVWTLLYYLAYVAASRLPGIQTVVGKGVIPLTWTEAAAAVLQYKYAPVFWYLFQLLLLITVSPVVYLLVKHKWVGATWLVLLAFGIHFHIDTQRPNTDALFYYSFAACAAVHGRKFPEGTGRAGGSLLRRETVFGAAAFLAAAVCFRSMRQPDADVLWTVFYRLLVPTGLWLVLDGAKLPRTRPWMRQSMFLYAIHYLIVRSANKAAALAAGLPGRAAGMAGGMAADAASTFPGAGMAAAAAVVYLALPALAVFVSYLAALFLTRYLPPVWRVLSGGRSLDNS